MENNNTQMGNIKRNTTDEQVFDFASQAKLDIYEIACLRHIRKQAMFLILSTFKCYLNLVKQTWSTILSMVAKK